MRQLFSHWATKNLTFPYSAASILDLWHTLKLKPMAIFAICMWICRNQATKRVILITNWLSVGNELLSRVTSPILNVDRDNIFRLQKIAFFIFNVFVLLLKVVCVCTRMWAFFRFLCLIKEALLKRIEIINKTSVASYIIFWKYEKFVDLA